MTRNRNVTLPLEGMAPLALHIRRLRQFYGEGGLTQMELAHLVGISNCRLNIHEHRRALPHTVKVLVSLSLALNVSIEGLIDPRHLEQLRSNVEQRRQQLILKKTKKASTQGGRRSHVC